jgi:polyferredoxin
MTAADQSIVRRPRIWGRRVQLIRQAIQLAFAGFIALVVYRHVTAPAGSEATAPSPEAYCPLGGFEGLYQWATTGGQFVPHTHASNLVLAGALALSALVAGGFFCGWVCPFGALQEAVASLGRRAQHAFPPLGRAMHALRRRAAGLTFLDRWLRYLKYFVLAWVVAGTALYGVLVFRDVDPWIALLSVTELELTGGAVVLAIVVVASFFVERAWCRYACPLGAIVGALGLVSPMKIEREAAACLACDVCTKDCPTGIAVQRVTRVTSPQCIGCLECVSSCPTSGGLALKLVLPGVSPSRPGTRAAQAP